MIAVASRCMVTANVKKSMDTHAYIELDSSWINAQIWLAISLGSKSLRPQVCFLDPMLSGT